MTTWKGKLYKADSITFTANTDLETFDQLITLYEKIPIHNRQIGTLPYSKRKIGTLRCIEDQETKSVWIYDVIPVTDLGFSKKQLVLLWLSRLHPDYEYCENPGSHGYVHNGMPYYVTGNYDDIPFGERNAVFKGYVIAVTKATVGDVPSQNRIWDLPPLLSTAINRDALVSLNGDIVEGFHPITIHDPIHDDKLEKLLTKAEKQFRTIFSKHLQGKYDIESYQKAVEMIVAKLVDEWNEDQYH